VGALKLIVIDESVMLIRERLVGAVGLVRTDNAEEEKLVKPLELVAIKDIT